MSDRITGLLVAAFALWYGLTAGQYTAGFTDPLGPSAFPQLVSIPLGVLALYLMARPDAEPNWPRGAALLRQGAALAVLVVYAMVLRDLGFIAVTTLAVLLLARLLGGGWGQSALAGVGLSVGLYCLFEFVLGLSLPEGRLFSGGRG